MGQYLGWLGVWGTIVIMVGTSLLFAYGYDAFMKWLKQNKRKIIGRMTNFVRIESEEL